MTRRRVVRAIVVCAALFAVCGFVICTTDWDAHSREKRAREQRRSYEAIEQALKEGRGDALKELLRRMESDDGWMAWSRLARERIALPRMSDRQLREWLKMHHEQLIFDAAQQRYRLPPDQ